MQPEPSLVLSQLSQRQPSCLSNAGSLPLARQSSPPSQNGLSVCQPPLEVFSKAPELSQPPLTSAHGADSQSSSVQQRQIKTQRRRIPPTSKVRTLTVPRITWGGGYFNSVIILFHLFIWIRCVYYWGGGGRVLAHASVCAVRNKPRVRRSHRRRWRCRVPRMFPA